MNTPYLLHRAHLLVLATMAYNIVEAAVGMFAGIRAGSVALVGFSLDSIIEVAAGAIVAWRIRVELRGGESASESAERRARRFVAITFFALAAYIVWESASRLWFGAQPEGSILGIALAAVSLVVMPVIAAAKIRIARKLESGSLEAEAKETLACAILSFTLLVGLVCLAVFGWWWADAVAALAMVPWLVLEGKEGFEDEAE
jgi:divalent metal cation (Fe/Co/Zn/Cd) transporter